MPPNLKGNASNLVGDHCHQHCCCDGSNADVLVLGFLLTIVGTHSYTNSTECLSARIKASIGIGLAERMVKDFVEAPGVYGQLSKCMKGWDAKTRSAVAACKSSVRFQSLQDMHYILSKRSDSVTDSTLNLAGASRFKRSYDEASDRAST